MRRNVKRERRVIWERNVVEAEINGTDGSKILEERKRIRETAGEGKDRQIKLIDRLINLRKESER